MKWNFKTLDQFKEIKTDWENLNQNFYKSPLLSFDFVNLTLKYFSSDTEIIGVCNIDEHAEAIIILSKKRLGIWETFQPSQSPLGAFIYNPKLPLESILKSLSNNLPGICLQIGITQLDCNLINRPKDTLYLKTSDYIQTSKIRLNNSFENYWDKRGKNLKQNIRRQRNRLHRENINAKLVIITQPTMVGNAISDYGELESAGWKAKYGTAISLSNTQGKFYHALLELFCQKNNGRIYQYFYNDKLVATDLCIIGYEQIIVLKTTYDETQKTSSPSLLLKHEYFEDLFEEEKLSRIEFYGKVTNWHTKWTNEIRKMYHINFYKYSFVPWLKRIYLKIR